MIVICRFLGKQFGLVPDSEEDEFRLEQVNATIHDFLAEGVNAFHGKDPVASYSIQKEDTQPYIDRFVTTRLPRFLNHFEKILAHNRKSAWLVGDKVTYGDLGLLHVIRATEAQFPQKWDELKMTLPKVVNLKKSLEDDPNLKAYFASERCPNFGGDSMM